MKLESRVVSAKVTRGVGGVEETVITTVDTEDQQQQNEPNAWGLCDSQHDNRHKTAKNCSKIIRHLSRSTFGRSKL